MAEETGVGLGHRLVVGNDNEGDFGPFVQRLEQINNILSRGQTGGATRSDDCRRP